ncbi:unnamed protein product [Adineta steineri]|uniref:Uncharacterized protein n=1 Tax=Adineta steineri TaxID=433720 RepID=A0A819V5U7_9BILA|nr:unnamed protein product [Adineta steineri]
MLQYVLAIQILEQCPQLRSFSAKLYVYSNSDGAKVSSALLSTRISSGLPNMKKLSLGGDQDFYGPFLRFNHPISKSRNNNKSLFKASEVLLISEWNPSKKYGQIIVKS